MARKGRNEQLIRTWALLVKMRSGRYWNISQLADAFGVTERTVRRDLEALQSLHFPLIQERGLWRLGLMKEWPLRSTAPIQDLTLT